MRRGKLRKTFGHALLAASLTGSQLLTPWPVWGQDPPPELPETRVEAAPPTTAEGTNPNPAPYNFPQQAPSDPFINGFMFGSPAANGYNAEYNTAGSIISVPDGDLPATVNTITRDLMNDQQAISLRDIVRNAPGVTFVADAGGIFGDRIYLRGLEVSAFNFRKDGFLDPTYVPRDFQNIERVEILKGPASPLYGPGLPSGMVNLITKKPLHDTFADFGFMFGSFNQQRYTLDANGYVNRSGSLLYRLNIAQEETESFRDFGYISRALVAPALTWEVDPSTRITYLGEWHRDHRRGDQGLPMFNGNPLGLPVNTYVGEPTNDFLHTEEFRNSLMLTHDINDCWTYQIGAQSLFFEYPGSVTGASGNPIPGVFPDVPEPFYYRFRNGPFDGKENAQSVITNLAGEFDALGMHHRALVGAEYVFYDSESQFSFGALPPINALDPQYFNPPAIPFGTADFPVFRQQRFGAYLQDLVEISPNWLVLGGVRFDTVDFEFNRSLPLGGPPVVVDTEQTFDRVSPRAGIVYQPFGNQALAAYFNYSKSFSPPPGGGYLNPGELKPIIGELYESGVKTQLTDWLSLNACGFYVTRENADINTRSFFLVQVGEERSQGAEVSLMGNLTQRWSMVSNYTYTDVRLSDPLNPLFDGNQQRNIPYNTFNLWSRYNIVQNCCQTVGVALGVVALGERPGDLINSFDLPGYTRWDAGLFYNRGRLYSQLYVENLFDTRYAASSVDQFQIFPGAPINARAQVGVVF